jgi:Tol biopolymer transport system component
VSVDENAQLAITRPGDPTYEARRFTRFTGICYHPQWSPDGGQIVFVSDENRADDIWVKEVDGRGQRALTRNTWQWDKHPSWSPDSQRIAHWSNRNGLAQIYVMDAFGRADTNISQSQQNEWDPLWVR